MIVQVATVSKQMIRVFALLFRSINRARLTLIVQATTVLVASVLKVKSMERVRMILIVPAITVMAKYAELTMLNKKDVGALQTVLAKIVWVALGDRQMALA